MCALAPKLAILEVSDTTPSCRKPDKPSKTGFFGLLRQIYRLISMKIGTTVSKTCPLLKIKKINKNEKGSKAKRSEAERSESERSESKRSGANRSGAERIEANV